MPDRSFALLTISGLLLLATACASTPPEDEPPARVWLSVGGELENFADDEAYCIEEAQAELDAPVDERMFAVCMFTRGWRENRGVNPSLATVAPVRSVRSRVNVRAQPSRGAQVLSALSVGERAQLLGREGDWYHVRLGDGKEGYVSARWTRTLN